MLTHLGRERTDALLVEFLASCPANSWPALESEAFVRWFEDWLSTWVATDEPPVV